MKPPISRPALVCVIYVLLHLAAQLSARAFEIAPGISVWYPPCGLALSLLVLLGPRYAWVVFAANVAGALIMPGFLAWWAPIVFPALITANYTLVACFVRRFMGKQLLPGTTRGTLAFAAVLAVAPLGAAVAGTTLIWAVGKVTPGAFAKSVAGWWLGDLGGLLTVVPVIMVFVAPWLEGRPHPAQRWGWEPRFLALVAGQAVALLGSLWFVFSKSSAVPHSTLYICFLPLIWTCLRHGLPGATLATLVLTMGSLIGMHGADHHPDFFLLSFLLFGLAVAVVGLGLGSAVTRRNEAEAAAGRRLAIIGATTDFVLTVDGEGRVVYANSALLTLLGLPNFAAIAGQPLTNVFPAATSSVLQGEVLAGALARGSWQGDLTLSDREKREIPVSLVAIAHPDVDNEVSLLSLVMRDITAQKLAEAVALNEKAAARLAEEKARLELLRYQLNPHFLLNAFTTLRSLIFARPDSAGDMLSRLADFCRLSLTRTDANGGTVADEGKLIESYLATEVARWRDELDASIEIDPAVASHRLPPFLLQPLVENAIKYGGRTSPGKLEVRVKISGGWTATCGRGHENAPNAPGGRIPPSAVAPANGALTIEVANTGRWVEPNPSDTTSTGIGMENLRQRLHRYYPDAHSFEIQHDDQWVRIKLQLQKSARDPFKVA